MTNPTPLSDRPRQHEQFDIVAVLQKHLTSDNPALWDFTQNPAQRELQDALQSGDSNVHIHASLDISRDSVHNAVLATGEQRSQITDVVQAHFRQYPPVFIFERQIYFIYRIDNNVTSYLAKVDYDPETEHMAHVAVLGQVHKTKTSLKLRPLLSPIIEDDTVTPPETAARAAYAPPFTTSPSSPMKKTPPASPARRTPPRSPLKAHRSLVERLYEAIIIDDAAKYLRLLLEINKKALGNAETSNNDHTENVNALFDNFCIYYHKQQAPGASKDRLTAMCSLLRSQQQMRQLFEAASILVLDPDQFPASDFVRHHILSSASDANLALSTEILTELQSHVGRLCRFVLNLVNVINNFYAQSEHRQDEIIPTMTEEEEPSSEALLLLGNTLAEFIDRKAFRKILKAQQKQIKHIIQYLHQDQADLLAQELTGIQQQALDHGSVKTFGAQAVLLSICDELYNSDDAMKGNLKVMQAIVEERPKMNMLARTVAYLQQYPDVFVEMELRDTYGDDFLKIVPREQIQAMKLAVRQVCESLDLVTPIDTTFSNYSQEDRVNAPPFPYAELDESELGAETKGIIRKLVTAFMPKMTPSAPELQQATELYDIICEDNHDRFMNFLLQLQQQHVLNKTAHPLQIINDACQQLDKIQGRPGVSMLEICCRHLREEDSKIRRLCATVFYVKETPEVCEDASPHAINTLYDLTHGLVTATNQTLEKRHHPARVTIKADESGLAHRSTADTLRAALSAFDMAQPLAPPPRKKLAFV